MLSRLHLDNFRSHSKLSLDFSEKTNVIIGPNGAGKTNILEAVLVLASGKSYRPSEASLIKYGADFAKIVAEDGQKNRTLVIEDKLGATQKTFHIQGKPLKRLSFHTTLPVVVFEPEFMQILMRGPDGRRDYIDSVLSRTVFGYQTLLSKYRRVLAQRNALLKAQKAPEDQLFVWDIKLSELGVQIVRSRLELLKSIEEGITQTYTNLASKSQNIALTYLTKTNTNDYANSLLGDLRKNFSTDRERGFTSSGPHRDDIGFNINQKDATLHASRGENRTLLLSLKIFELGAIEKARDKKPILLLDDVFSELDETRQTKLIEYFKNNQVIITTTNITPLMKGVSGNIIEL